jgi:hypothetical protein
MITPSDVKIARSLLARSFPYSHHGDTRLPLTLSDICFGFTITFCDLDLRRDISFLL